MRKLAILIALFFTACAASYGPRNFFGGYSEARIDDDTFRVSFIGNGYTRRDFVELAALYRAAELAKLNGYDYFAVVSDRTAFDESVLRGGNAYIEVTGNRATLHEPSVSVVRKPENSITVKLFKAQPPESLATTSYKAEEVLANLAPSVIGH